MIIQTRRFALVVLCFLTVAGCVGSTNYESILRKAQAATLTDGLDRNEAVLLAQRYVILSGLDQDVSVWHVDEAVFLNDSNVWQVLFGTGLDNKVGDRRNEKPAVVRVEVNNATGVSRRLINP